MKKRGNKALKILFGGIILASSSLTVQTASAQDSNVVQVLNQIAARIDSIVSVVASYIFQPTPNLGATVTTNYTNFTIAPQVVSQVQQLNNQDLLTGLSPSSDVATINLTMMTKAIPASDSAIIIPGPLQVLQSNALNFLKAGLPQTTQQQALAVNNQNFNYQSLVSYPVYTGQQQQYALNYIKTVADSATPISQFSLQAQTATDKDFQGLPFKYQQQVINDVQSSPTYQKYQAQRRTMIAQQSAALANLYRIYTKRLPQPSLLPGDTAIGTPAPSIQQIEDYIATWRVTNPTWYAQMSTAAPATVARETLFVLAEIEKELHNIHMDNEKLITFAAINELQSISGAKKGLAVIEPNAVQVFTDSVAKAKASKDKASGGGGAASGGGGGSAASSTSNGGVSGAVEQKAQGAEEKAEQSLQNLNQ